MFDTLAIEYRDLYQKELKYLVGFVCLFRLSQDCFCFLNGCVCLLIFCISKQFGNKQIMKLFRRENVVFCDFSRRNCTKKRDLSFLSKEENEYTPSRNCMNNTITTKSFERP